MLPVSKMNYLNHMTHLNVHFSQEVCVVNTVSASLTPSSLYDEGGLNKSCSDSQGLPTSRITGCFITTAVCVCVTQVCSCNVLMAALTSMVLSWTLLSVCFLGFTSAGEFFSLID